MEEAPGQTAAKKTTIVVSVLDLARRPYAF